MKDYAQIWKAADKVVYSTTLEAAVTARTRIERRFDPDAVREMKRLASRDLSGGERATEPSHPGAGRFGWGSRV